ncbi:MAG: hypothetical protein V1495_10605 [Pseudomonadota bacterium]
MAARCAALILAGLFAFGGCASNGNALDGSIGLIFPLSFQKTKVLVYLDRGIQILYVTPISGSTEEQQAVNLFVDNSGVSIAQEVPIDLVQHGTIRRFGIVKDSSGGSQEDRRPFPAIQTGSIVFHTFTLTPGNVMAGQFQIIFATGDTLLGDFSAPLEVGDPTNL